MRHYSKHHRINEQLKGISLYGLFRGDTKRDKKAIKKYDLVPTNARQCKVKFDGRSVYSNSRFFRGDIIEICPTRMVDKSALYSKDVRDMVFEVEPDTTFVIPFGYCQHYDIISKKHPEPNCDYEWNPDDGTIIIRALCTVPKDTRLILNIEK